MNAPLKLVTDNTAIVSELPESRPASSPRLSIFGLGYVGAVSAGCFTELGFEVLGVDPDIRKLGAIAGGRSPVAEPQLEPLLAKGRREERLQVTTDAVCAVLNTEISLICVGTPTAADGSVDFRYLDEACRQVGAALGEKDDYHLVVVRSTVPAGTTPGRLRPILEAASGKTCGPDFGLCFNPEFLREGAAVEDFREPPKTVVGGFDQRSAAAAALLYSDVQGALLQTTVEAAETVKYVDNAWHALKVAFGNEVGRLCKASGIDSHEVMRLFVEDRKLNISGNYLQPGFAFGGSCLPKDLRGIAEQAARLGVRMPLLDSVLPSNQEQIDHALALIDTLPGRIGFLGLTFKPETDDLRESPMLELMAALRRQGRDVEAFDPSLAPGEPVRGPGGDYLRHTREDVGGLIADLPELLHPCAESLAEHCDVLVIGHDSAQFLRTAMLRRPDQNVVDLVRLGLSVDPAETYHGICW